MAATILVVDSDPVNCATWETLLLDQRYEVVAARTGETALTVCSDLQPDLVLLSYLLPDIKGLEVCRRLKAQPRNCLTPVVLLTSDGEGRCTSEAIEAGVDDFLGDPTMHWEALSRVHYLLQLKAYIDDRAKAEILSLAHSIDAEDAFRGGHSARVSNTAVRLGKSLGLSANDLEALRIGGLVHDIGKIGIPDAILSKPGPLAPDESEIIRGHPILGEQICAPLKSFRDALPLIRSHHERMNGTGYPDGLCGDEISLIVRLLQIVDICDALTSDRTYRQALSLPRALVVLYEEADRGWLDEALVSQFALITVGAHGLAAIRNGGRLRSSEMTSRSGSNSNDVSDRTRM
jgi:putative two-component system response regulator